MSPTGQTEGTPYLKGVRVLEIADELGEYAGRILAGMGADVVKIEPVGGEPTRHYGPFYKDVPDINNSLYFWHYNLAKRSVELDLDSAEGQEQYRRLALSADIVLDTRKLGYFEERGLDLEALKAENPGLIYAKVTAFGEEGPWAAYEGSDLVHLALGGIMMNCGYDARPDDSYDTPPIAPQIWQAYHIAGEMTVMALLAALSYKVRTGKGQRLSLAVHDAVSKNSETDIPDWVSSARLHYRVTCSHSIVRSGPGGFSAGMSSLARTKDGRWLLPYGVYGWVKGFVDGWPGTVNMLKRRGMQLDFEDEKYKDVPTRAQPHVRLALDSMRDKLIEKYLYEEDIWREGQAEGMPWAPIRKPEENVSDEHWIARGTFTEVFHPEHNRSFTYTTGKWRDSEYSWRSTPRPPLLGEHTAEVLAEWPGTHTPNTRAAIEPSPNAPVDAVSNRGKPFALSGIRVLDLTWMLASAGSGRFLSAYGAEVIKVEHETRWDGLRFGMATVPNGGRAERDAATGPLSTTFSESPNRSFNFMEINSGKLGTSLNLKSDEGKEILRELIKNSDVILEGFSPGTMDRMGFGYEVLKELNPDIIYVQQSGFGQAGTYGGTRAYGPTAQALTGLSDMSGLPEPFQPAGWGYSYLDWFGAYNMANAILAAVYRREVTGKGCWIDASQGETGLYLTSTTVLDHSANGRTWYRYGNRSPYKKAAPHGAFPVAGEDRWIAIAAFTEEQWAATAALLDPSGSWSKDERFATLEDRLANQDALEAAVSAATASWKDYELQEKLQAAGVPAGVAQNAQDRFENDPQLPVLKWTVELEQEEIGWWPTRDVPGELSETPGYIGGVYNRFGPSYGQDTEEVYGRVLGLTPEDVSGLRERDVLT